MAIEYYVEFITVPALALLLACLTNWSGATTSELVAGYLSWVWLEWWMHSYLFHRVYRKRHWKHHLHPFDQEGSPSTYHVHLALAVLGCSAVYTGVPAIACGLTLGYGTYIGIHHAIHAQWLPKASSIRLRHEMHHRGLEKNFNLLNPLGDMVMGTYVKAVRPS